MKTPAIYKRVIYEFISGPQLLYYLSAKKDPEITCLPVGRIQDDKFFCLNYSKNV